MQPQQINPTQSELVSKLEVMLTTLDSNSVGIIQVNEFNHFCCMDYVAYYIFYSICHPCD